MKINNFKHLNDVIEVCQEQNVFQQSITYLIRIVTITWIAKRVIITAKLTNSIVRTFANCKVVHLHILLIPRHT